MVAAREREGERERGERMGPQKAARRNEWHCSIKDGLTTMQTDEVGSNPGCRDGDGVVDGLVLPSTLRAGEAMNKFVCGQLTVNSDEFCGLQSANVAASFSSFPQISAFHGADRLMEGIPLGCPLENTRYGLDGVVSSSLETMLHGYHLTRPPPPPPPAAAQSARSCHPREWMMMEQGGLSSNSSQFSNELSLSLVTSRPSVLHVNSIQEQCSEMSSSGVTSFDAHKPSQLPPLMSGSRFLEAMQEILAEIACYAVENMGEGESFSYSSSCIAGRAAIESSNGVEADHTFVFHKQETNIEAKKKYLLALLQMVDDQYSQCLDEIHTITSAFHAVTELDPNLHARFALPTISLMYKNLRERISSHILAAGAHVKEGQTRENKSFEACFIQKQWALQQLNKRDHQLWRPQRGLPETSVSVLRTWMFQNFLHPYPKDSEKHLLALKSGLTRNQVSNWFINARVRLWKPMIEEMCAEMNRRKARRGDEEMEGNHRNHMHLETRRFTRD